MQHYESLVSCLLHYFENHLNVSRDVSAFVRCDVRNFRLSEHKFADGQIVRFFFTPTFL